MILLAGVLAGAACGPAAPAPSLPPHRRGVEENLAAGERHEQQAEVHEGRVRGEPASTSAAPDIECHDDPLEGVTSSGGERYQPLRPCWTEVADTNEHHRREAERHRRIAAEYRARAEQLVTAEARSCRGLGEAEISRSPLTHAADVLRVDPIEQGGTVVGARVLLRRVPGLSAAWLRRSLACHQARAAALGYPSDFMTECPSTLPNVAVEVAAVDDGFAVSLRAARDEIGAAVLGRAEAVLTPYKEEEH